MSGLLNTPLGLGGPVTAAGVSSPITGTSSRWSTQGVEGIHITSDGTVGVSGNLVTRMERVTMKELDSEVFNAPVSTLSDLWVTRFGNGWVDLEDVEKEPMFLLVYKRLRSLGQLEQHYLTDRARFVCRKPE